MARYRFLQDCYVGGAYYAAGDIAQLPDSVIPPPGVDPLDAEAVQAFFNAGPQVLGLQKQRWTFMPIPVPVTYWKPTDAAKEHWQLTGLGSHLGAVKWAGDSDRSIP
jgi:hypothetical protein